MVDLTLNETKLPVDTVDLPLNKSFVFNVIDFAAPKFTTELSGFARFGHSSNFSNLFGTQSQVDDYIGGLVRLAILSASFTLAFILLIVTLRFCGQKRVGFLSGKPFHRTRHISMRAGEPMHNSNAEALVFDNSIVKSIHIDNSIRETCPNQVLDTSTSVQKQVKSTTIGERSCCGKDQQDVIRWIVIFSGITVILFSILLVTQGLRNINNTAVSINRASYEIMNITGEGIDVINITQTTLENSFSALTASLISALQPKTLCPVVYENVSPDAVVVLQEWAAKAVDNLEKLNTTLNSNVLNSLSEALLTNQQSAENMYDTTSNIDVTQWGAALFIALNSCVVSALIASTIMAMNGWMDVRWHHFVVWILFPFFVVLVIVTAIVSSASVAAASSNSDYCYPKLYESNHDPTDVLVSQQLYNATASVHFNSPDVSSLQSLLQSGYDINSTEYAVAFFYITQCSMSNPFGSIEASIPTLSELELSIETFINNITAPDVEAALVIACNRDYSALKSTLMEEKAIIIVLMNAIVELFQLIRCDKIVPIYQEVFYNSTCEYSLKALFWIYSASLIMSFFGFLMITFRAAFSETVYTDIVATNNDDSLERNGDLNSPDDGLLEGEHGTRDHLPFVVASQLSREKVATNEDIREVNGDF